MRWRRKMRWKRKMKNEEMCLNVRGDVERPPEKLFAATQTCPSYRIPAPESPEFGAQFKITLTFQC